MKSMKFRVKNELHSSFIQTKLIEMGYSWSGKNVLCNLDSQFLYANADTATLTHDERDAVYFEAHRFPEYTLQDGEFILASEVVKPPIGLRPRSLASQDRAQEILAAMARYVEAGVRVPDEWIGEFESVNYYLKKSDNTQ